MYFLFYFFFLWLTDITAAGYVVLAAISLKGSYYALLQSLDFVLGVY